MLRVKASIFLKGLLGGSVNRNMTSGLASHPGRPRHVPCAAWHKLQALGDPVLDKQLWKMNGCYHSSAL